MARFLATVAAALLAGIAQAFSMALPGSGEPLWWVQMLSLAGLAWLVLDVRAWRGAALLGWVFATAWMSGTFWWLFISMHVYGGLPSLLAAVAVFALAAFLALYYAAAMACFAALDRVNLPLRALLFASVWLLADLLRATWFTGFPWGAGGYAHVDGPLSVMAPLVGVYGIGFMAALLAFWLSLVARSGPLRSWWYWGGLAAAAGLLAACNSGGSG